jgi:hypothetical protein
MDDKILESDFFERDTPPSCCELLAILFTDARDGGQEVTGLHDPRGDSAPNDSTVIEQPVTYETTER